MLRQNRFKIDDFYTSSEDLVIYNDEIILSVRHDMVLSLEPYQVDNFKNLQEIIIEVIKKIPEFDNETQDYYETISEDIDFPHDLAVICFEGNKVILEYWSIDVNNQFDIVFSFEDSVWQLKRWNTREVPYEWHKSIQ